MEKKPTEKSCTHSDFQWLLQTDAAARVRPRRQSPAAPSAVPALGKRRGKRGGLRSAGSRRGAAAARGAEPRTLRGELPGARSERASIRRTAPALQEHVRGARAAPHLEGLYFPRMRSGGSSPNLAIPPKPGGDSSAAFRTAPASGASPRGCCPPPAQPEPLPPRPPPAAPLLPADKPTWAPTGRPHARNGPRCLPSRPPSLPRGAGGLRAAGQLGGKPPATPLPQAATPGSPNFVARSCPPHAEPLLAEQRSPCPRRRPL